MKNSKYIIFAILLLSLQSCQEKDILKYENDPRIGFSLPWYNATQFRDSITYSFPSKGLDTDKLYFDATLIGLQSDKDRQIEYKINPEGTTAIEGTHFKIVGNVLPAGKSKTQIAVEVYRTADIKNKSVRLELEVVENSEFKFGYDRNRKVIFVWSDMYLKPDMWEKSNYSKCFGAFSQVKYEFILRTTELTELSNPDDFQYMSYLNALVRKELSEYKRINGQPLLDENNKEVVVPSYGGGGVG